MDLSSKYNSVLSSLPDDIEKGGMYAATSVLQQKANEIRSLTVSWQSYLQIQMISEDDYNLIVEFDSSLPGKREQLLKENPTKCVRTFLNLIHHISKEQTLQRVLVMIDDMFQEDKSRVEIFKDYAKRKHESVWKNFTNLLSRQDPFITNMTGRIIAKMACWSHELMDGSDLHLYLTWLKDQLRIPGNEYIQSVARCLQMMLRIDEYRMIFVTVDGVSTIVTVLAGKVDFQIQYQLIFCLWVMTFNGFLAEKMCKYKVIPILSDILSESAKEKVWRVILATFRNLIEKPDNSESSRDNAIAMVQCKVLKQLEILQGRKCDDPDIEEDIKFLNETLQASVQDLSSFDEYSSELMSTRLEWSPVHNSAKFWRENAFRLNEKNYELLKILIRLLEISTDPLVLSVAAHDIGEYVRHYPRGKQVIEKLGGKQLVMQLLTHTDPNVRYQALLCVQKLMVYNWEYLGRQLEKETTGISKGPAAFAAKA
ncbi:V-type proton ATPase subunit H-like [Centruroides sculpturatus]|uniref:V-type proton ATPase subunit H-like n=1 Tax=Centruroides sculpturatus TaxID=218467 RepID=UPI000C6CEA26|nr:V-type proton ATPase subunit H-like [Centruroides sculpturatus]XP_023240742.1 V-type proton ATPase subunit H-like [Centruroides sculpturatus]XP_023240748.1 V-type proton ATPase subunit H-like [Centruroides sculpturatus]XP_023240750.1 V-type proton ATPase subunit H-like [Centruroides sculpturatus]